MKERASALGAGTNAMGHGWWDRLEPLLFTLLTALHLVPVHATRWFVTLDGPSHLYSARILKEILAGDPFLAGFFRIHAEPVPYWLAHALMVPLHALLPAWAVDRVMYSLAVVGLAFAFRWFIRTVAPQRSWTALLVMPFLLHYALRLGFLNFSLSLALLFVVLTLVVRGLRSGVVRAVPLGLALLLLYFAHLTTFLVGAGAVVCQVLWYRWVPDGTAHSAWKGAAVRITGALALPGALTLLYFVRSAAVEGPAQYLPFATLVQYLWQGRAWNGLGAEGELWASTWSAVPLLAAGAVALGAWVRAVVRRGFTAVDLWPLLALASLVAYFTLPDVMAGGSSASPRLQLFSMLFVCVLVAVAPMPRWVSLLAVGAVVAADVAHTRAHYLSARSLGEEAAAYLSIAEELEQHTVVLPLNYGSNWMHSNFPNYMGVQGPTVVVLDHFTALAPFNPEQWVPERLPYKSIGTFAESARPCVRMGGYAEACGVAVDAVVTWKLHEDVNDSCAMDVRKQLAEGYTEAASGAQGDVRLFRLAK